MFKICLIDYLLVGKTSSSCKQLMQEVCLFKQCWVFISQKSCCKSRIWISKPRLNCWIIFRWDTARLWPPIFNEFCPHWHMSKTFKSDPTGNSNILNQSATLRSDMQPLYVQLSIYGTKCGKVKLKKFKYFCRQHFQDLKFT